VSAGGGMGPTDRQFPEFFAGQFGPLRRLGLLLTGDWAQAEELAQETLVRVWWRWPQVRRQQHPEAHARTVLVDRHRSLLRRRRLEARHAGPGGPEPGAGEGSREELLVVRAAVGRLPARQRAVLVLRYHQDLPEQQVARLLRIPLGTVKSTTSRALARLRATWREGSCAPTGRSRPSPRRRSDDRVGQQRLQGGNSGRSRPVTAGAVHLHHGAAAVRRAGTDRQAGGRR
jgi:RNA polymerase sigma-70 factor (sigma-E family)